MDENAFWAGVGVGTIITALAVCILLVIFLPPYSVMVNHKVIISGLDKDEIDFWTEFLDENKDLPKYVECNQVPKIVIEPKEVKREIVIPIGNVKGCE